MKTFQELKKPANKAPVERIMEDYVRSSFSQLSNEEQTEIYNDLMYDFFDTIRTRISRGLQPMRISDGNKVWKNYRNLYVDKSYAPQFEKSCREAFDMYTKRNGNIPTNFGNEKKQQN